MIVRRGGIRRVENDCKKGWKMTARRGRIRSVENTTRRGGLRRVEMTTRRGGIRREENDR